MAYTQQLHQLQQTDSQMLATHARLKKIAASLVESDALKMAKQDQAQAESAYRSATSAMNDLDLDVKGLQERISQNEKRLYGGAVTSPKEAGSLQDEIESSKRRLATQEEKLLEAMMDSEAAEADHEEKQAQLTRIQGEWEMDQEDLLREQKEKQAELTSLAKARATLVQFINQKDLAEYDRLRKRGGGTGLAEVKAGSCLSCGVMVSSQRIQQARSDNKLYFCDSCGRIIHVL